MKTRILSICLLGICLSFNACYTDSIRGSEEISTVEIGLSGYTGLEVSHAFNAFVRFSETEERIEIEANENIQDKIRVRKEGDNLVVELRNNTNLRGNVTLNVYITTRSLTYFRASGASNISLQDPLVAGNTTIRLSGASNFFGEINTGNLELRSTGASEADIFGSADDFDADLNGSSTLRDYDLVVGNLNIELSGASDAYLSVTETIDIDASGASTLNYKGDAQIGIRNLSGASEIRKR